MQFRDLQKQYEVLKPEMDAAMIAVASDAHFISGEQVKTLEERLAAYVGRKHCITCGNGTDALELCMMAWGVGPGDAVFVPDFTFFASGEAVSTMGGTPVFYDVCADTFNADAKSLEAAIEAVIAEGKLTPKAVVDVDLFGLPADHEAVAAVCKKHGLLFLEDAAQGFGGMLHGKRNGAFGDAACTSFFPAKPLGCYGDGGAVFTDDDALNDLIRSLCVHGKGPGGKYDNIRVGMNSRLDNLQAAVLLPKLKALADYETVARQTVAGRYNAAFAGKFTTPFVAEGCLSAWAQYALLAEDTKQRDRVIAHLTEKGIPNMVYYPTPQHALPVFRDEPTYGETFRNANDYCARTFSLPMHPYLTEAEQETVIAAVLEAL